MRLIEAGGRGEPLVIEMDVYETIALWRDLCTAMFALEERAKTEEPGERLDDTIARAKAIREKCILLDEFRLAHEQKMDEEIAAANKR